MNNRRTALYAILLTIALPLSEARATESKGIDIGDPVPMADTMMKNVDGKELSIAGVKGEHGTLVVFSCNACPWAKAWEERIADMGNTYAEKGVGVIIVNSNDPERVEDDSFEVMQTRAKELGLQVPYVVDSTSTSHGPRGQPDSGGIPLRRRGKTRVPRHHRRQRQGAGPGEQVLPAGCAGLGGCRNEGRRPHHQGPGLRDQVPPRVEHPLPPPGHSLMRSGTTSWCRCSRAGSARTRRSRSAP